MREDFDYIEIFCPYVTRNGKRDWAYQHGLKAWRLLIPRDKYRPR